MSTKVVINTCYGGFGLSEAALDAYYARKGITVTKSRKYSLVSYEDAKTGKYLSESSIDRTDRDLIAVIEQMGSEKASGSYAELTIEEVPTGVAYRYESVEKRDDIDWRIG